MGFRYGAGLEVELAALFEPPTGQIDLDDVQNEGASSGVPRADHTHAFPGPTGPPPQLAAAGDAGTSARPAAEDHTHAHTAAHHDAGGHADLTGIFAPTGHAHPALDGFDTQGLFSARPGAGNQGATYYATDIDRWYRDDGTDWHHLVGAELVSAGELAGDGVIMGTVGEWAVDVTDGDALSLINIHHHNLDTVMGASAFNAIRIGTDSDAMDTASAIAIHNVGHSDGIYIGMQGKPGEASAPTGIGLDVNRAIGFDTENRADMNGTGLHAWDWSSTDQGVGGPRAIHARKQNNPDSAHRLVHLYANRNALVIETPEGGAYNAGHAVLELIDSTAAQKAALLASGDWLHAAGHGTYFGQSAGNQAFLIGAGSTLSMRIGQDGLLIYTNAGTLAMGVTGAGWLRWHDANLETTVVGAAGAAAALPATPQKYLEVVDSAGAILLIPAYLTA